MLQDPYNTNSIITFEELRAYIDERGAVYDKLATEYEKGFDSADGVFDYDRERCILYAMLSFH
ncbi:MAG: hypothetical protein IKQ00_00785 [Butyrivibrio sp.]|nr:hypothetical protein [Butyrivibrio sp.]